MKRDLRHIGIVGLLMWSLVQAWFGHDLLHGHHHEGHRSSDEATHTKAVYRIDANVVSQLLPVALLVGFCDFLLPEPVEESFVHEIEIAVYIDPQFLDRPQSPRAPPIFSFIV